MSEPGLFFCKVDGLLPHTQHVNVRVVTVGQPSSSWLPGFYYPQVCVQHSAKCGQHSVFV